MNIKCYEFILNAMFLCLIYVIDSLIYYRFLRNKYTPPLSLLDWGIVYYPPTRPPIATPLIPVFI